MCVACGSSPEITAEEVAKALPTQRLLLSVPDMVCGACVANLERSLEGLSGVLRVRANLTLKRITIEGGDDLVEERVIDRIKSLGFHSFRIEDEVMEEDGEAEKAKGLLRAVGVAGFGAANIMLLSVSSWSGADGSMRDFLHLISALIAVPIIGYAGRPFFRSALSALSAGRVNMDVPISLAVLLSFGMSIFQTLAGETDVYFDAAVMLLFFLLIGRYLDALMRAKAKSAALSLAHYVPREALEVLETGETRAIAHADIQPGMRLRVQAGGRVPTDCVVQEGRSEVDRSMVTGESEPVPACAGTKLEGGALNLSGPLTLKALCAPDHSFMAEVARMLETAEQSKSRFVRIADRAAQIYTPFVHIMALVAFVGWMVATGGNWHQSLLIAISILIITCPCALGLAVPVAHVVAAAQLFKKGLLIRNGSALERLAKVRIAIFDKTGTLTTGQKQVTSLPPLSPWQRRAFGALARYSSHPSAAAINRALSPFDPLDVTKVQECPGEGIQALCEGKTIALSRSSMGCQLKLNDYSLGAATFSECLQEDAPACVHLLNTKGISSILLSGDNEPAVLDIAGQLGVKTALHSHLPAAKLAFVQSAQQQNPGGVLMVGDGINDAPSLAAADVSIAPSSATEIGRQAADVVLARPTLASIPQAIGLARRTERIVRENFAIAVVYNAIAIPLALSGYVTPLVAALAMSASSVVVISNSLRLAREASKPEQRSLIAAMRKRLSMGEPKAALAS